MLNRQFLWMVPNHALQAVPEQDHVPVDNQPQRQPAQFQISQQLAKWSGRIFSTVLIFHQDQLVDSHIDAIPYLNQYPLKLQGKSHFTFHSALTSSEFMGQAGLLS